MHSDRKLDDYELIECIDDGLSLFGQSIKYTVYWRLVILHDVPRGGILENPEAFVRCLEDLFSQGAKSIESAICTKIKQRFSLPELESESLSQVIHYARKLVCLT